MKNENVNLENIKQELIEIIADFLDSESVELEEIFGGFGDPKPREETDLHIKMAEAAMKVYKNTVKTPPF
jgi:hypothetical protein